jgi:hypothetical protein
MTKFLRWLAKQSRILDNWLLLLAIINWIYIFNLSRGDCRGFASPWYCSWTWYFAANRLLLAALCIRSRRTWLTVIGLLISLHVVAGQLFYFFNTDQFSQILFFARDFKTDFLRFMLLVAIEHELTQGFVAALIAIYASRQIMRSISGKRHYPAILRTVWVIILILTIGYLSNFISHAAAERATARWLYHDVLRGSSLYGDLQTTDYLKESAERFASVGANVFKVESEKYLEMKPWAEVGPSNFAGPFFILVAYHFSTSDRQQSASGHCLVLSFFGYSRILDKDSSLFWKPIPYLIPY